MRKKEERERERVDEENYNRVKKGEREKDN